MNSDHFPKTIEAIGCALGRIYENLDRLEKEISELKTLMGKKPQEQAKKTGLRRGSPVCPPNSVIYEFSPPERGKVRGISIQSRNFCVLKDVLACLGIYGDQASAYAKLCPESEKRLFWLKSVRGRALPAYFVTKKGLRHICDLKNIKSDGCQSFFWRHSEFFVDPLRVFKS